MAIDAKNNDVTSPVLPRLEALKVVPPLPENTKLPDADKAAANFILDGRLSLLNLLNPQKAAEKLKGLIENVNEVKATVENTNVTATLSVGLQTEFSDVLNDGKALTGVDSFYGVHLKESGGVGLNVGLAQGCENRTNSDKDNNMMAASLNMPVDELTNVTAYAALDTSTFTHGVTSSDAAVVGGAITAHF